MNVERGPDSGQTSPRSSQSPFISLALVPIDAEPLLREDSLQASPTRSSRSLEHEIQRRRVSREL